MPNWRRSKGSAPASPSGSATPSPAPSPSKRFSLVGSSSPSRHVAEGSSSSAIASGSSLSVPRSVPTVSVSPPETIATMPLQPDAVKPDGGWTHKGSDGSDGSSPDEDGTSVPPSMTTGSTSASIESLESIQHIHQRAVARSAAALANGGAKVDVGGGITLVSGTDTHTIPAVAPPTSLDSSADGSALLHSEFGYCANPAYRHVSSHRLGTSLPDPIEEEPSYYTVLTTYLSYAFLIVIGHMRDFVGKRLFPGAYRHLVEVDGYAALNSDFDSFYTRRLKARIDDCFSRPVTGVCGRTVQTLDRVSHDFFASFQLTGNKTRALNVSAYNYLGFAQSHGGCADAVKESLDRYGVSSYGSRHGVGSLDLHAQAERLVAKFVGQEDACIISMGFATNSTTIPALAGPGTLIISDEFNHSSIRFGARLSGASIRQYKHNSMRGLEKLLRECISQGMPRTHRPWKKILLLVEGLYSMEGTLVNLPELMRLKEKYKFYLYVDEAHSIGAIGPNGRGVCDYFGIDPKRVDILMGTFTKSFGAAGGYIAGSKAIVDRVRLANHANIYGETLAPPVLTQIIASMASIMGVGNNASERAMLPNWVSLPPRLMDGSEGGERLRRLAFNARYLSSGLRKLGFIVYGHRDSPIVPMLIFHPSKMAIFSRMMLDRQASIPPHRRLVRHESELTAKEIARINDPCDVTSADPDVIGRPPIVVVVVAYPATPLISARARFCVSASHTKKDMDDVLRACDELGDLLAIKYGSGGAGGPWTVDQVVSRSLDLVEWNGTDPI